jgi:hypothetical protein
MIVRKVPVRDLDGLSVRRPGQPPLLLAAAPALLPRLSMSAKRPEDTAAGCRANADADLTRAAAPGAQHFRWRFEHSAAAWAARAELLDKEAADFEAWRPRSRG